MKYLRRILFVLVLLVAANGALALMMLASTPLGIRACLLLLAGFVYVNLCPIPKTAPTKRIDQLSAGCELLRLFLITATINVVWMLLWLPSAIRAAKSGGFFSGLLLGASLPKTTKSFGFSLKSLLIFLSQLSD